MAKIYETRDPAVQLTGPQDTVGFQPAQAFDPSRNFLAEADRRTRQAESAGAVFFDNQARDIEALVGFSDTLGKYMVQKAEERNKADYLRGLTDLSVGEAEIKPEALQKHQQQTQFLKAEAEGELQVANEISQTNPAAAESFYNRAPARSGWENYGRAVRQAQLTAAESSSFFSSYLNRTDPGSAISITQQDGSTRTFVPAEARNEEELAAVMAAASSEFMTSSGLARLNPAIIAEHVLPRFDEARAGAAANRMKEIFANNRQDRLDEIDVTVSRLLASTQDPQLLQDGIAKAFDDAYLATRDRRASNEFVSGKLFEALESLGRSNPNAADAVRGILKSTPINPNKPELGTLYDRFESQFDQIDKIIQDSTREQELVEQENLKQRIDDILGTQLTAQQTGNLTQAQKAYDSAEAILKELSAQYPNEASTALVQLRGRRRNYSIENERVILQNIKDPDELSALLVEGFISQEGYDSVKDSIPSSDGKAKINGMASDLIGFFTSILSDEAIRKGANPDNARAMSKPLATQLVNELQVYGYNRESAARAAGQAITTAALYDELLKRGQDQLKNNARFQVSVEDGVVKTRMADPNFVSATVKLERGPSVQELTNRALDKLPKVASAFSPSLDKSQVEANIEAIRSGGKPDERVRILAAAANVSDLDLLKTQANRYGINTSSLDSSTAGKAYQANLALDPTAARILANPRSTRLQRQRAGEVLERARNRQTYQQNYSDGKAFADLRTAIVSKEGGAQGYNAANRGSAGDTPGGVPNLTSMTIQEVLNLYNTGGYNVLGGYQFKRTTLQGLLKDTGIPLTSKFTPEVQDQLFESYFTNGSNNRKRLSGYVSGQNNDLRGALEDLSLEFAAVRSLNGRGQYDGTAGNRATLDAAQLLRQMREERVGRGRPVDMSANNIQSFRIETPGNSFQPGVDMWFADKRFGAVLPGTVKEIRRNAGNYGNMVIVESTDPATGETVDALYAHLASISVAPGQRIRPGQMVGVQGGTGRVVSSDGTIASVDFLAPAPRGSNSMKPYRYWRELAGRLQSSIQSGRPL
jgi:DNA-binding protein YbaB